MSASLFTFLAGIIADLVRAIVDAGRAKSDAETIGIASCFARHVRPHGPHCTHVLGHAGPHSWETARPEPPGLAHEVADLRAALEEANAWIQRQGEEAANLRCRLADARAEAAKVRDILQDIEGDENLTETAQRTKDGLMRQINTLRAEVTTYRADLAAAAGELLVPIPSPGSPLARVISANAILRRANARANALANTARAWAMLARKALATFPELTASPEALALMQASDELDAGLGPLPPRLEPLVDRKVTE